MQPSINDVSLLTGMVFSPQKNEKNKDEDDTAKCILVAKKSGKAGQRPLSDLLPFLSYLNQHQTQTPCVPEKVSRVHGQCGLVLRDYGTYEHLCSLHFNISVHFLQFFAPSSPFLFVFCGI